MTKLCLMVIKENFRLNFEIISVNEVPSVIR